jgi:hypothetical protein
MDRVGFEPTTWFRRFLFIVARAAAAAIVGGLLAVYYYRGDGSLSFLVTPDKTCYFLTTIYHQCLC